MSIPPSTPYVSPGMPPLTARQTFSFFEFWPTWLMYLPVAAQWLGLATRHRSLTLPLLANPNLPIAGMVGVPKSTLLSQAQWPIHEAILPWQVKTRTNATAETEAKAWLQALDAQGWSLPLVFKPDIGCRGAGVKRVDSEQALTQVLASYPAGAAVMIQKLSQYEPEAGIFYVREPKAKQGQIISMALKYMPYVMGDGRRTLGELIESDERAGQVAHLYKARHSDRWHQVLPAGEPFRLVFSASHSKGAIFKDARDAITPELTARLDTLMKSLPDFHYGRLDVKFKDIPSLKRGETLEIIEINTASSEPLHIWDSDTSLKEAVRALCSQYRTLWRIGQQMRAQGQRPPGIKALLDHWRLERQLTTHYPTTD